MGGSACYLTHSLGLSSWFSVQKIKPHIRPQTSGPMENLHFFVPQFPPLGKRSFKLFNWFGTRGQAELDRKKLVLSSKQNSLPRFWFHFTVFAVFNTCPAESFILVLPESHVINSPTCPVSLLPEFFSQILRTPTEWTYLWSATHKRKVITLMGNVSMNILFIPSFLQSNCNKHGTEQGSS